MNRHFRVVGARSLVLQFVVTTLIAMFSASSLHAATQQLFVSNNGRFLVMQDGTPFFWMGDTNWRTYKLARPQIRTYIENRAAKGFNVLQGPVLLHPQATNETMTPAGVSNTNPSSPTIKFFRHIDFLINTAEQHNMYVAPVVVWGHDLGMFTSTAQAQQFGNWLGNRYRNHNNVIWIVAGEYLINGFDSAALDIFDAIAQGLKAGSNGRHLVTIHGSFQAGAQSSSIVFHNASWLDFNMLQSSQSGTIHSGADNWTLIANDFNRQPVKPVLDGEAHYEQLGGWNAHGVRRRAYWSVFAGAFGHTYGANGLWQSLKPGEVSESGANKIWKGAMNYIGSSQMQHLRALIESRPMLSRIPDMSVLTSFAGGVSNHIHVTRDNANRYLMAYIPNSNRTFTINVGILTGSTASAWWYNPRNGNAMPIGQFSSTGLKSFTSPPNGPDWVLVVDNVGANFPPPGQGGPIAN